MVYKSIVTEVFGGWGKRSTRYRRLAQCASVCPSCRQVDSTDENVLISNGKSYKQRMYLKYLFIYFYIYLLPW